METTRPRMGRRRRWARRHLGVPYTVPMRARLTAVLVVVAVGVAGCGGGEESADESSPTTTTVTTGDGDERPSSDDQAKAEAVVLQESDFPADWTSEPAEGDDEEGDAAFRACLGLEPIEDVAAAEADSPVFRTGGATEVKSSATVTPTADVINETFAAFEGPKMLECLTQNLEGQFEAETEVTLAPPRAEKIDFPELGDGSTAVRVTSSFPADGEQVPLYIDLVAIKKDRVGMALMLVNAPEPFPTAAAVELAQIMVARA